ncbi:MAG: resolvase [Methanosphaera sp. rholeuAM270]|nr:MAG: resolvase [Methanosphaera sp. rholeuAM270]
MSSKVHVTKPLSSKLIIEILNENPDLEEINCPLSLYERTSKIYLEALTELGVKINIIEVRGRPKKYDDELKNQIDEMIESGLSVKTIASKLNISSKTVYYLKKDKLKQGPKSKYSEKTIEEIVDMRNEGVPVKQISEKLNIPIRTVYYILKNKG